MRRFVFLLGLAPLLAGANECQFSAQHDFDVDAAGLKTLALALGSTDVVVEGVKGLAHVEVRAKACASEQAWLDGLVVQQQRADDRLTLTPQVGRHAGDNLFHSSYAYIDLRVRVPSALAVDIASHSGDASVRDVAALDFDSSSGDLQVGNIAGTLALKLSSADVEGAGAGAVAVRSTASGDVSLRDIRGNVQVTRAGSGDLHFSQVGGSVAIGTVGSGDVSVSHVGHDVSVDSIGSGDVDVDEVGGNFSVRANGSGNVHQSAVHGTVSIPPQDD